MNYDLLMRFIDGTATAEEVETVIEMLSKNDEAAKEWMQLVQAARLADTAPAVPVSEQAAAEFVQKSLRRKKVIRLPLIIGSVAAVAAAVALIITISFSNTTSSTIDNGLNNGLQAGVLPEDTAIYSAPSDTTMEEQRTLHGMKSGEYMAETKTVKIVESQKKQIDQVNTAGKGEMQFQDTPAITDTAVFNVLKPAKSPYRVKVKNLDKDFVFEWEASGVMSMHLVIVSSNGAVLFEKLMYSESRSCPVAAAELTDRGELKWTLTAVFDNDTEIVRDGVIELVSIL